MLNLINEQFLAVVIIIYLLLTKKDNVIKLLMCKNYSYNGGIGVDNSFYIHFEFLCLGLYSEEKQGLFGAGCFIQIKGV